MLPVRYAYSDFENYKKNLDLWKIWNVINHAQILCKMKHLGMNVKK